MRRREFTAAISATIACPPHSHAQQPGSVRRVGVLMAFNENDPDGKAQLSGFVQELAELGWLVGRNLRMEVRWGGSDVMKIGIFAKELLALQGNPHVKCINTHLQGESDILLAIHLVFGRRQDSSQLILSRM